MVSSFSSFIEFFAAVYVTMCIDNAYCKQFWTPVYYKEMNNLLSSYDFSASSLSIDKIKSEIEATNKRVQDYSQHKGGVMLCFCVVLLVFIGFEGEESHGCQYYASLIYSSLAVLCLVVTPNILLRTWRWVCFWLLIIAILYYIVETTSNVLVRDNFLIEVIFQHLRIVLVLLVSFPILHQLYLDWLYSRIYKAYLSDKVKREYDKYKKSLEGIQSHKEVLVHDHYKEACFKSCFSAKDDDADDTLTLFNEVLRTRLLSAASPNQLTLLLSLFRYWVSSICNILMNLCHKNDDRQIEDMNIELDLAQFMIKDYSAAYQDYVIESKKPNGPKNIRAYCKLHNLDTEEMIIWVKKTNPNRKRKR